MLNDEIETKYSIKKEQKKTWFNLANPQNSRYELWNFDNPIKSKSKQIIKFNTQLMCHGFLKTSHV
jgi:hypothetical protein